MVARTFLEAIERAVRPYRGGDHSNFVEAPADASAFFDEDIWARLRRAKAHHDPTKMFHGNHHVPPAR